MPLFSFKKSHMLSIDIGYRNIKIVESVVGENDFLYIKNFGIGPTPRECIRNGHIVNPQKIVATIRKVLDENNIHAKYAKIVTSGTHFVSRLIVIPEEGYGEPVSFITKNLPKFMPNLNTQTHEIDYKVLEKIHHGGRTYNKVFVAGLPKTVPQSYIDILLGLSLVPISIDIPPYSIGKFFRRKVVPVIQTEIPEKAAEKSKGGETVAIIDFGAETTKLHIMKKGVMEFYKVILEGSAQIDRLISDAVYIHLSEAELLKHKYGLEIPDSFRNKDNLSLRDLMLENLERMALLIEQSFLYYGQKCAGDQINRIYISGGGGQLKGLDKWMSQRLNIPAFFINALTLESFEVDQKLDREKLLYLMNACGSFLE